MGLLSLVVQTLQSARAPSTRTAYSYSWELFVSWCATNQIDAVTYLATEVLWYLEELLEVGKSPPQSGILLGNNISQEGGGTAGSLCT